MDSPMRDISRENYKVIDIDEFDRLHAAADAMGEAVRAAGQAVTAVQKSRQKQGSINEWSDDHPGDTNWIGRLLEYRAANPAEIPTAFHEPDTSAGPFNCTVTIAERPDEPLGSQDVYFGRKKEARQYACKCAIEWLIENKFIAPSLGNMSSPADGGMKTTILGAPRAGTTPQSTNPTDKTQSCRAQVADLAVSLGMSPPEYKAQKHDDAPGFWDIYAVFPGDMFMTTRIGETRNVYGKDRAREACAKGVLAYLQDIKKDRLKLIESVENSLK